MFVWIWGKGDTFTLLEESCKLSEILFGNQWKLELDLPHDPTIPLLGMYPNENNFVYFNIVPNCTNILNFLTDWSKYSL